MCVCVFVCVCVCVYVCVYAHVHALVRGKVEKMEFFAQPQTKQAQWHWSQGLYKHCRDSLLLVTLKRPSYHRLILKKCTCSNYLAVDTPWSQTLERAALAFAGTAQAVRDATRHASCATTYPVREEAKIVAICMIKLCASWLTACVTCSHVCASVCAFVDAKK